MQQEAAKMHQSHSHEACTHKPGTPMQSETCEGRKWRGFAKLRRREPTPTGAATPRHFLPSQTYFFEYVSKTHSAQASSNAANSRS